VLGGAQAASLAVFPPAAKLVARSVELFRFCIERPEVERI